MAHKWQDVDGSKEGADVAACAAATRGSSGVTRRLPVGSRGASSTSSSSPPTWLQTQLFQQIKAEGAALRTNDVRGWMHSMRMHIIQMNSVRMHIMRVRASMHLWAQCAVLDAQHADANPSNKITHHTKRKCDLRINHAESRDVNVIFQVIRLDRCRGSGCHDTKLSPHERSEPLPLKASIINPTA